MAEHPIEVARRALREAAEIEGGLATTCPPAARLPCWAPPCGRAMLLRGAGPGAQGPDRVLAVLVPGAA
jgi:hypothetical protein